VGSADLFPSLCFCAGMSTSFVGWATLRTRSAHCTHKQYCIPVPYSNSTVTCTCALCGGCRHEHIIRWLGHFEDEECIHIVQEWAAGGDLFEELKNCGNTMSEQRIATKVRPGTTLFALWVHHERAAHRHQGQTQHHIACLVPPGLPGYTILSWEPCFRSGTPPPSRAPSAVPLSTGYSRRYIDQSTFMACVWVAPDPVAPHPGPAPHAQPGCGAPRPQA